MSHPGVLPPVVVNRIRAHPELGLPIFTGRPAFSIPANEHRESGVVRHLTSNRNNFVGAGL